MPTMRGMVAQAYVRKGSKADISEQVLFEWFMRSWGTLRS